MDREGRIRCLQMKSQSLFITAAIVTHLSSQVLATLQNISKWVKRTCQLTVQTCDNKYNYNEWTSPFLIGYSPVGIFSSKRICFCKSIVMIITFPNWWFWSLYHFNFCIVIIIMCIFSILSFLFSLLLIIFFSFLLQPFFLRTTTTTTNTSFPIYNPIFRYCSLLHITTFIRFAAYTYSSVLPTRLITLR